MNSKMFRIVKILSESKMTDEDQAFVTKQINSVHFLTLLLIALQQRVLIQCFFNLGRIIGPEVLGQKIKKHAHLIEKHVLKYQRTKTISKIISFVSLEDVLHADNPLEFILQAHADYRKAYDQFFDHILNVLHDNKINYVIMKGRAVEEYYDGDHIRDTLDIDIFIENIPDYFSFLTVLQSEGHIIDDVNFRRLFDDNYFIETSIFSHSLPHIPLDIHHGTMHTSGSCYYDCDFWNTKQRVEKGDSSFYTSTVSSHIGMVFSHAIHHGVIRQRDHIDLRYLQNALDKSESEKLSVLSKKNVFHNFSRRFRTGVKINPVKYFFPDEIAFFFMRKFSIEYLYLFDYPYKSIYCFLFCLNRGRVWRAIKDVGGEFIRFVLYFIFALSKIITPLKLLSDAIVWLENEIRVKNKVTSYRYDYYKINPKKEPSLACRELHSIGPGVNLGVDSENDIMIDTPIGRYYRCDFKGRLL